MTLEHGRRGIMWLRFSCSSCPIYYRVVINLGNAVACCIMWHFFLPIVHQEKNLNPPDLNLSVILLIIVN
uniref:Uncharacterized protein n=1 Tax=Arundo donax TaxID=35708 RepID=A0A0A9D7V7_ARUDO